jgi:hypothetical protein
MSKPSVQLLIEIIGVAAAFIYTSTGFAADTHVITTKNFTWVYKSTSSMSTVPLAVDDLKVGDIIEVTIADDGIDHGFVTTKKNATPPPPLQVDLTPVQICGENNLEAPLREIGCGSESQFNKPFIGTMRLEVTDKFKEPIGFFCVIHGAGMPGMLKLAP